MTELGSAELRRVIAVNARIAEARDLAELARTAVDGSGSLVGASLISYNEIGGARVPTVLATGPAPTAEEAELFGRLIHQNPMFAHLLATGDGRARRFSDFLGDRELRRLPLHREIYASTGVNHQVALSTRTVDGRVIGLALSRDRHDFTAAEVASLELLRPHLAAAYVRLSELEWHRQMTAAIELEAGGPAVLLVDADGTVLRSNPAARELLGEDPAGLPGPLRPALGAALDAGPEGPRQVAWARRGTTLSVRFSPVDDGATCVVALALPAPERVKLAALAWGLSAREAEVLAALAAGEALPRLARRLGISPRTAEKHLGNAYRKLEVGGRAEALAKILAAPAG
jgi:DNA-binding CsgD family transcriptional regulator/PAS domain-containing protein